MEIRRISHLDTLKLRRQLIRPWLQQHECVFPGDTDADTSHLGCFLEGELVGIASLYCRNNQVIMRGKGYQLRAMATSESCQKTGLGSTIIRSVDELLGSNQTDYLWANARISAKGFYQKNGFSFHGDIFEIDGVGEHVLVYKKYPKHE